MAFPWPAEECYAEQWERSADTFHSHYTPYTLIVALYFTPYNTDCTCLLDTSNLILICLKCSWIPDAILYEEIHINDTILLFADWVINPIMSCEFRSCQTHLASQIYCLIHSPTKILLYTPLAVLAHTWCNQNSFTSEINVPLAPSIPPANPLPSYLNTQGTNRPYIQISAAPSENACKNRWLKHIQMICMIKTRFTQYSIQ